MTKSTASDSRKLLEHLVAASSSLLGVHGEDALLNSLVRGVQDSGFGHVRVYLLTEDRSSFVGKASDQANDGCVGSAWPVTDDIFAQSILTQPIPRVITSAGSVFPPFGEGAAADPARVRDLACIPLVFGGTVLGAICADNSATRRRILQEDLSRLSLFAAIAAAGLANGRSLAEAEVRDQRLLATLNVSTVVGRSPNITATLVAICKLAVDVLAVDHASVVLFAPNLLNGKVVAEYPDFGAGNLLIPLHGVSFEGRLIARAG